MKTISVAVSESDYESFRRAAQKEGRPIAQLIREAMAFYLNEKLGSRPPLTDLPLLVGHKARGPLPGKEDLYDDIFTDDARTP